MPLDEIEVRIAVQELWKGNMDWPGSLYYSREVEEVKWKDAPKDADGTEWNLTSWISFLFWTSKERGSKSFWATKKEVSNTLKVLIR